MNSLETLTPPTEAPTDEEPFPDASAILAEEPIALSGNRFELQDLMADRPGALIYSAQDLLNDDVVAIKLFKEDRPIQEQRHDVEMAICEELDHPNIVKSLGRGVISLAEVDTQGTYRYMAMPLASERTLASFYRKPEINNEEVLVPIIKDMAEGLAEMHDNGLIHRDIKPSNVLIDKQDGKYTAILSDFELAVSDGESYVQNPAIREALDANSSDSRTPSTGSQSFMAPEQEIGKAEKKSDIYSLGKTILRFVGVGDFASRGYFLDEFNVPHELIPPQQIPIKLIRSKELSQALRMTQHLDPAQRPSAAEIAQAAQA